MAEAVARAIDDRTHLMVEAGTGVGKSFAYLVPAILAAAEAGKKVVVSTHTISLQEQLLQKDLPFLRAVMPQEFTAVLVKGRSNYISLRRMEAAAARAGAVFQHPDEFDQLSAIRLWSGRTEDGSRSDLDFRPLPSRLGRRRQREWQLPGPQVPPVQGLLLLPGEAADVVGQHPGRQPRAVPQRPGARAAGASFLPDYEVAIFDEAHTLEAVAGEHLGLKVTSGQFEYTLGRLFNDRTGKGLLAFHDLDDAMRQVQRVRFAARDFFDDVADWQARHGSSNGRLRKPVAWPDTVCEELRKLSSAIGRGADAVDADEQRIELVAMQDRCDVLAGSLQTWIGQALEESVYWIEVEGGAGARSRCRAPRSTSARRCDATCGGGCRPAS